MKKSTSSIAVKLTPRGGPEPVLELERVFEAAQEDPAGMTWIATRKPGKAFIPRPDSELLAFASAGERAGSALVLRARILERHEELPPDALVRDMYEDYTNSFHAYWKITDACLREMLVEELSGATRSGRRIADAFRGQLSFAYWLPDASHERPAPRASAHEPRQRAAALRRHPDDRPAPRASAHASAEFAAVRTGAVPLLPLHGVDFSGARETGGRNRKIWIASWHPDRDVVELRSGGADPGFDRAGLAAEIIGGSGTWVIDFPFGPPAAVAVAAGWNSWREYLAWCGSNPDPTALRDELREVLEAAGVRWPTKRRVDHELGTTWFPFFEQLYRQTIMGGRDVLRALDEAGRDRTRILPFHDHAPTDPDLSVVIEGFPGWTLDRCGLSSDGYKHSGRDFEDRRRRIVNALRERGIPISDADASTAVRDADGDALDALVLLLAAQDASRRTATEWDRSVGPRAGIEGWFFD